MKAFCGLLLIVDGMFQEPVKGVRNYGLSLLICSYRNTEGTLNYQSRIHKFSVLMDPVPDPSGNDSSQPNIRLNYLDTILLTGPDGVPTTSLDPDATGFIQLDGFPPLPPATYEGDGFGSPGVRNARVAMDCEGLVLDADGSFWISDEYGPYIYKFSEQGKMIHALQPPHSVPTPSKWYSRFQRG
jgi:hypothetical protein